MAARAGGGAWLRALLGQALTARADALGGAGACACGGRVQFRQRRPARLHTVLPGRDVDVRAVYGQCAACHRGHWPVLAEVGVDGAGFTVGLQELAALAAVLEPYEPASAVLLQRLAGVGVSAAKLQAVVQQEGDRAEAWLEQEPAPAETPPPSDTPMYVAIDGGMIFVDGRWQEVKLGCLFGAEDRMADARRPALVARQVVAVRRSPELLATRLWPRAQALGAPERRVIVLGDGAPWIWNLAAEVFPNRVEILDWYHADEHVSATARAMARAPPRRPPGARRNSTGSGTTGSSTSSRRSTSWGRINGRPPSGRRSRTSHGISPRIVSACAKARIAPRGTTSAAGPWRVPSATSCSSA